MELSDRFSSIKWLNENGIVSAHTYTKQDIDTHRNFRWSKLLSDRLEMDEWNVYDDSNLGTGTDIQFFEKLLNDELDLTDVSYVFQEVTTATRMVTKFDTYTPAELLSLIGQKKLNDDIAFYLNKWLSENENGLTYKTFENTFNKVILKYPHIKFYLIDWYGSYFQKLRNTFSHRIIQYVNTKNERLHSFSYGLEQDKFRICDSAFCYTSNNKTWKTEWVDEHANKDGQKHISNFIYNYLNRPIL
jgi:hypothetical protein